MLEASIPEDAILRAQFLSWLDQVWSSIDTNDDNTLDEKEFAVFRPELLAALNGTQLPSGAARWPASPFNLSEAEMVRCFDQHQLEDYVNAQVDVGRGLSWGPQSTKVKQLAKWHFGALYRLEDKTPKQFEDAWEDPNITYNRLLKDGRRKDGKGKDLKPVALINTAVKTM